LAICREGETAECAVGRCELSQLLRGPRVPEADRSIGAGRRQYLAVRREDDSRRRAEFGRGSVRVRHDVETLRPTGYVPERDAAITAGSGQRLAVRREGDRFELVVQAGEAAHLLARGRVPQQDGVALLPRHLDTLDLEHGPLWHHTAVVPGPGTGESLAVRRKHQRQALRDRLVVDHLRLLARGKIPDTDGRLTVARREGLAIDRVGERDHPVPVPLQLVPVLARLEVPQVDDPVSTSREDALAGGRNGDGPCRYRQDADRLAGARLPQTDLFAGGRGQLAVGRNRHGGDAALMALELLKAFLARGRVPQTDDRTAHRHQCLAVGGIGDARRPVMVEAMRRLAGFDIEDVQVDLLDDGGELAGVGREGKTDGRLVLGQSATAQLCSLGDIPDTDTIFILAIDAAGGEQLAVVAVGEEETAQMGLPGRCLLGGPGSAEADHPGVADRQGLAVGGEGESGGAVQPPGIDAGELLDPAELLSGARIPQEDGAIESATRGEVLAIRREDNGGDHAALVSIEAAALLPRVHVPE